MNIDFIKPVEKTDLYVVQNGIGKVILFSNMLRELENKNNKKISIASPYPELFTLHPSVESSMFLEYIFVKKDLLENYFNDIIYFEPYISNYMKGSMHMLDVWRKFYGLSLDYEDDVEIFTDEPANNYYNEVMKNIKMPYIIIQLKGGTNRYNKEPRNDEMVQRNYINEYELIKEIHDAYPKYFIMIVKTKSDIYDERCNTLQRICTVEDESLQVIQELVNNCASFVGIDSCIQHMACNKNKQKPGIVLWNNITTPKQIGHSIHKNILSNTVDFVQVDPSFIVAELQSLL